MTRAKTTDQPLGRRAIAVWELLKATADEGATNAGIAVETGFAQPSVSDSLNALLVRGLAIWRHEPSNGTGSRKRWWAQGMLPPKWEPRPVEREVPDPTRIAQHRTGNAWSNNPWNVDAVTTGAVNSAECRPWAAAATERRPA